MTSVGRNQPCPCGSGKKYKVCHLRIEEDSPAARARAIGAIERRYMPALKAFAATWRPECIEDVAELFWLHRETPDIPLQLMAPYGLYHRHQPNEPSAAEEFHQECSHKLMANERALLKAQIKAWLSIWEILEVERGVGLKVRDRLTGVERFCYEQKGSEALVRRDVVLGRVVDCDGVSCFFGMYGRRMNPEAADDVEQAVRRKLRKKGAVSPEALGAPKIARFLIEEWQEMFAALDSRPLPKLVNTDGEDLLLTIDRFTFDPARRRDLLERVAAVDGMEREYGDEPGQAERFAVFRAGNAMHKSWENTVLGHLSIEEGTIKVETNSVARADWLRAKLETALGQLVRFRIREHTDPMAFVGKGEPSPPREHSPEEQAILREFAARHYESWIDTELPALSGQTPRQATSTAAGRRAVDVLLREMENHSAHQPEDERYDFGRLRRTLDLD
jgi:hypothetical protein